MSDSPALVAGAGAIHDRTPPSGGVAVQFYHLTIAPLERALPKLLEKAYAGGYRTLLVAEDEERVEQLNQLLWTYDPASFLPHGSAHEGRADVQPILLSAELSADNKANFLVVTDGRNVSQAEQFERILDIFDGSSQQATDAARARWSAYKNAGHEISYFKQTEQGGWEKKA